MYYDSTNDIQSNTNKKIIISIVLYCVLIVGRLFSPLFVYAIFILSVILFCVYEEEECFCLTIFLLPFSVILKTSETSMTIFTFIFILLVVKLFWRRRFRIEQSFFMMALILAVFLLFNSGISQVTSIIKMISGMFMVVFLKSCGYNFKRVIYSFSVGIIVSSLLGLLRNSIPIINNMILQSSLKVDDGEYVARFAGLQGNPNYYSLDLIVVLALFFALMLSERIKLFDMIIIGGLSIFGFMTVSKSFLIAYAFLIVIWMLSSFVINPTSLVKNILIVSLIIIILVYFAADYISLFMMRLTADRSGSLNSITTGRFDIWKDYVSAITNNIKILIVGNGINTTIENGKGCHNTYIELIFSLGFAGTAYYIAVFVKIMKGLLKRKLVLIPLAIILLRMTGIGILTYDNVWFYFSLICLLSNYLSPKSV